MQKLMQKKMTGINYARIIPIQARRLLMATFVGGSVALSLSSCALDTPTQLSKAPITVSQELHKQSYKTESVDRAVLNKLRTHYLENGDGPVDVVVTYDPRSSGNTAMNATNNAGRIAMAMRKMGATAVNAEILPVKSSGSVSETVFSYDIYKAHAPENCALMGGVEDGDTAVTDEYMFGCSNDILLARQISRPRDLLGRGGTGTSLGRRHVNWVSSYHDGVPNEPIETYETTE